jgi:hypothetical protein
MFVRAFMPWPGIFHTLRRAAKAEKSMHLQKLKLRDLCFTLAVAICSALIVLGRAPPQEYWLAQSVRDAFEDPALTGGYEKMHLVRDPGQNATQQNTSNGTSAYTIPIELQRDAWNDFENMVFLPFSQVRTSADVRYFLTSTLPRAFGPRGSLVDFYFTPDSTNGVSLRLRQQRSENRDGGCLRKDVEDDDFRALTCLELYVQQGQQADYPSSFPSVAVSPELKAYMDRRSFTKWQHTVAPQIQGRLQVYDSSGFASGYNLFTDDGVQKYLVDQLAMNTARWIDSKTRLVTVDFAVYDASSKVYVTCVIFFELTSANSVSKAMTVRPVLFDFPEYGDLGYFASAEAMSLLLRQITAVFYPFLIVRANIVKKVKRKHRIWRYTFTYGLLDAFILALITVNTYVRSSLFPLAKEATAQQPVLYYPVSYGTAYVMEQLRVMDALVMLLSSVRVVSTLRIVRSVWLVLRVLGRALKDYVRFIVMFIPVFLAFVMLAYTLFLNSLAEFSTFQQSLITLLIFIRGDIDLHEVGESARYLTPFFMTIFFFVIIIFLINGFVGMMVLAMIKTQIADGDPWSNTEDHAWTAAEWSEWAFGGIGSMIALLAGIKKQVVKKIKKMKKGDEESDEEEEGEEEQAVEL